MAILSSSRSVERNVRSRAEEGEKGGGTLERDRGRRFITESAWARRRRAVLSKRKFSMSRESTLLKTSSSTLSSPTYSKVRRSRNGRSDHLFILFWTQYITHAIDCADQAGRLVAQFVTQVADVHIDDVSIAHEVTAPRPVNEGVSGKNLRGG